MNELTREQILAMPAGRELDNLIVKYVLRKATSKDRPNWYLISVTTSSSVQEWAKIPRFSKDIAAAWEVMEKIMSKGYDVKMHCVPFVVNTLFDCTIMHDEKELSHVAMKSTMPEAICKAALLAVMGL